MHRAVCGGITPRATRYFDRLVKYYCEAPQPLWIDLISSRCLAPLHDLLYVTPSLVALAARKIYSHRIEITQPENERSMQYGSNLAAVTELLEGVTAETIIEEVLAMVDAPL